MSILDLRYAKLGTRDELNAANVVLAFMQPGIETDTGDTKLGDGRTAYKLLAYFTGVTTRTYRGVVSSQAEMIALPANISDWVSREDLDGAVYELTALPPSSPANWTVSVGALATPVQTAIAAAIAANNAAQAPPTLQSLNGALDASKVVGLPNNQTLAQFASAVNAFIQGGATPPTTAAVPTIAGTMTVGSTLTGTLQTVTASGGHGTASDYQWNRENATNPRTPIAGAAGIAVAGPSVTYIEAAADLGFFLSLTQTPVDTVTGSRGTSKTSALTAVVTGTTPGNTAAPAISPSGSQPATQQLTLSSGTWNVANCTFGYLFYDNLVPIGTRSSVNTLTPGTARAGHTITGDVLATSPLGVPSAAVAASNSIALQGTATVVNTAVPTLLGSTSGTSIGIIQASAVDSGASAVTSLNNVLPQAAASGNFRLELVAVNTNVALSSEVASPGAVGWSRISLTDATSGLYDTFQAWKPAAYTNLDTSVLSSFASAKVLKTYIELDIIDTAAGLLGGAVGFSGSNPTFTWTTPALTGLTGDIVFIEAVYSGSNANLGFNNGGDGSRTPLPGAGLTSGHHSNVADGDDMYIQYRTVLGATAGQSFTGTGGFPGSGGGAEFSFAMILAYRKKAAGAGNNIQKGLTYNIQPGTWTLNGVATTPTSRSWDFYLNDAHPAGYSNANATYTVDGTAVVGQTFDLVEQAVIGGVTYASSLAVATDYTVVAAGATFTAVLDIPSVSVTAGATVSPFTPVRFINGTGPYTITTNPALPGLTINAGTGAISGTAGAAGTYSIAVNGQDSAAATASKTFQLSIQSASALPILSGIDADLTFASQAGNLQFGGGINNGGVYPLVSSIADTIGGGFTGQGSGSTLALVNNSQSRFGKFLDPNGSGKTVVRLASHPSDPQFGSDPAVKRCDVFLPGTFDDGETMWGGSLFMFPSVSYNYAGSFGVNVLEIHGGSDGNGFYFGMDRFEGKPLSFTVVRNSLGSYDRFDLSAFFSPDVYHYAVVRQHYDSSGATCLNQVWIDGVLAHQSTVLNWITGQGTSYPKVPWYNGGATIQAGGSYGYIRRTLYFKDNAQQATEPQIRARLGV